MPPVPANTPGWAVAIAAALILLVPVTCWAALLVNHTYVRVTEDNSHMRSSLHALVNSATAVQGTLQLTKQIAEANHEQVKALVGSGGALSIAPLAQSDAQLPTGGVDPQWYNDCGETCVAMLVAAKKGVPIGVARVRYLLRGPNGDARTTAVDLVNVLAMCDLKAHDVYSNGPNAYDEVRRNLDAGRSSVVLGEWITSGVEHWMEVVSYGDDSITFNDPWIGAHRIETRVGFIAKYGGAYVHMDV